MFIAAAEAQCRKITIAPQEPIKSLPKAKSAIE
jgi:hypothetical protein